MTTTKHPLFFSTSSDKPLLIEVSFDGNYKNNNESLGTELTNVDTPPPYELFTPSYAIIRRLLSGDTVAKRCGVNIGDCIVAINGEGYRRFKPDYNENELLKVEQQYQKQQQNNDNSSNEKTKVLTAEELIRKSKVLKLPVGDSYKELLQTIQQKNKTKNDDSKQTLILSLERYGWDSPVNSWHRFLEARDYNIPSAMGMLQDHIAWRETIFPIDLSFVNIQSILKCNAIYQVDIGVTITTTTTTAKDATTVTEQIVNNNNENEENDDNDDDDDKNNIKQGGIMIADSSLADDSSLSSSAAVADEVPETTPEEITTSTNKPRSSSNKTNADETTTTTTTTTALPLLYINYFKLHTLNENIPSIDVDDFIRTLIVYTELMFVAPTNNNEKNTTNNDNNEYDPRIPKLCLLVDITGLPITKNFLDVQSEILTKIYTIFEYNYPNILETLVIYPVPSSKGSLIEQMLLNSIISGSGGGADGSTGGRKKINTMKEKVILTDDIDLICNKFGWNKKKVTLCGGIVGFVNVHEKKCTSQDIIFD